MSRLAAAVLLLLLPACGWLADDPLARVPPIPPEERELVVADVLHRLGAAWEEVGPLLTARLPDIKRAAAAKAGCADWLEFRARLAATDPALEVEVSRRITGRIRTLLESAPR